MPMNTLAYYVDDTRYYVTGIEKGLTLDEVKQKAKAWACPIKFFSEQGMLKGTAYPNGEVQW